MDSDKLLFLDAVKKVGFVHPVDAIRLCVLSAAIPIRPANPLIADFCSNRFAFVMSRALCRDTRFNIAFAHFAASIPVPVILDQLVIATFDFFCCKVG